MTVALTVTGGLLCFAGLAFLALALTRPPVHRRPVLCSNESYIKARETGREPQTPYIRERLDNRAYNAALLLFLMFTLLGGLTFVLGQLLRNPSCTF